MALSDSIRLAELPQEVERLAGHIREAGYAVSHVFYIECAGRWLGEELARRLGCSCSGVIAARKGNRLKQSLAPVLSLLPMSVAHELRRLELASGFHAATPQRGVSFSSAPPAPGAGHMAVIDDAVDSGHSMLAVLDFLERHGFPRNQIVTVALTVTGKSPVYRPMVALYDRLLTLPWSPGSQDWQAYRDWLRRPTLGN